MDCSPPASSAHGILQARTLEWVAISFSRGSFWPRDQTHISCIGQVDSFIFLNHRAFREAQNGKEIFFKGGIYVYLQLIHLGAVQQNYSKASPVKFLKKKGCVLGPEPESRRGKTWDQAEEYWTWIEIQILGSEQPDPCTATFWVIGCWCPEKSVIVGRAASHEAALKELNLKVAC